MATAITIPDIGTTVDRVRLVKWLVKAGDTVRRGDLLCEVETDKAVSELESIAQGTVLKLLIEADTEIAQGTTVAYVGQPGEAVPAAAPVTAAGAPQGPASSAPPSTPTEAPSKVPVLIRNLAQQQGVDLNRVTGTGPGGRITREDVLRAKETVRPAGGGTPLPPNQVTVARRVARSHREIPPISLTAHLDVTNVLKLRKGLEKKTGQKPSFDAFFVKAAATVMKDFPHFRSRLDQETVQESAAPHVGVAIGTAQQLIIPVLHGAEAKAVPELDAELRALADKAAGATLGADDLQGATLTITNLGMFPVVAFQAIIPPDQVAVLAVGTVEDRLVLREGQPVAVPTVTVTLTVDHRLINGREGGEFLAQLKKIMEGVP